MRYEFEVGDYVKLIANQSLSSHSIGYIGKVAKVQNFPRAEMPGIWYDIDGGEATWSHYSELAPSTKAEYEAYHKPKPKFKVGDKVKLIANTTRSCHPVGYTDYIALVNSYANPIEYRVGNRGYGNWSPESDLELYTEPQFEVGDWVKVKCDAKDSSAGKNLPGFILKIGSIGDNYNGKGKYVGGYKYSNSYVNNHSHGIYFNELVPATYEEIKQHLLAEAERRGFKVGVTYTLNGGRNTAETNPELYPNHNSKFNLHCGCGLIYNDSTNKWATIVPADKELCGHKVSSSKDSSMINIGCKSISKGEIQGFLNVCDKFDITKVMSGYVKDKSITLDAIKEALK